MNIGVLGGTFDPVHNGHLILAEAAREQLNLAGIIMVPAGQPLLKEEYPVTPVAHRVRMLRLAIKDRPYLKFSAAEVLRAGPSYTVDTIAELRRQSSGDEFFLILGDDNLARLPEWHEPRRLITMCRLVTAPRPGYPRPDMAALEALIPGISARVVFLGGPEIDISSSNIRRRLARGESVARLVPAPVNRYLRRHHLYRK